jgi:hypothetical protein
VSEGASNCHLKLALPAVGARHPDPPNGAGLSGDAYLSIRIHIAREMALERACVIEDGVCVVKYGTVVVSGL